MASYRKNASESTTELSPIRKVESPEALVVGTTQLFEGGQIRYIPMPTPDPKDPLNLPQWRKWLAIGSLCFFGALALASEAIIAALIPVFVLEYAGIDPAILGKVDIVELAGGTINLNPMALLAGLGGPPLWQVSLLSSLPLLVNGAASYILVPLSIAIGRRPVLLTAGVLAWTGGLWAGASQSLPSHLAARCLQGLGAGAVEALIPLILQDLMFIHERNKAIASIGASQGFLIVGLGIASPLIVVRLSWRYIYWLTAGTGILAWLMMLACVPETRWIRTADELAGKEVYPLRTGETRPRLGFDAYGPRTRMADFGIFVAHPEWSLAWRSVWLTAKTTLFPNVFWVILVNSALVATQGAAGQIASAVLIAAGWEFETLGLFVVPIVIASPFVWLFGGFVADRVSNFHARWNGGRREPEAHLISLVVPLLAGIAGSIVYGYAGQNFKTLSTMVVLVGVFLIGFGFLTANALFSVYLVECYPAFAGPVLVNVSSIRLMVGFALSFNATTWVQDLGIFTSFAIYAGALGAVSMGLPLIYFYGKRIRSWTAGRLDATVARPLEDDEAKGIPL